MGLNTTMNPYLTNLILINQVFKVVQALMVSLLPVLSLLDIMPTALSAVMHSALEMAPILSWPSTQTSNSSCLPVNFCVTNGSKQEAVPTLHMTVITNVQAVDQLLTEWTVALALCTEHAGPNPPISIMLGRMHYSGQACNQSILSLLKVSELALTSTILLSPTLKYP